MTDFNRSAGLTGSASKLAATGIAALLTVAFSGSAMAQSIIVHSSGPSAKSYPVGDKLKEGTHITLSSGDHITILNNSRTQVLNGPGSFSIGQQGTHSATVRTHVASFVSRNGSRVRSGAVRGQHGSANAAPPTIPNVWFLDPGQDGNFCIASTDMLMAWRPDMSGNASATIANADGGASVPLDWKDGSRLKSWPVKQAPLSDGAKYRLTSPASAQPVEITFVVLNDAPTDIGALVETLIAKGCQNQVDAIVDTVSDEPA